MVRATKPLGELSASCREPERLDLDGSGRQLVKLGDDGLGDDFSISAHAAIQWRFGLAQLREKGRTRPIDEDLLCAAFSAIAERNAGTQKARAEKKGIFLDLIEPGRPMHNGFIERLKGSIRRRVLDLHIFRDLSEVREQAERWVADYNS